jgi:hypothetical protein
MLETLFMAHLTTGRRSSVNAGAHRPSVGERSATDGAAVTDELSGLFHQMQAQTVQLNMQRTTCCLARSIWPLFGVAAGSARLGSARLGSARLGSARLGSARLGSARLGSPMGYWD